MSEKLIIKGNNPLRGVVGIKGSKNAATKLMVASLLTKEPCRLANVPLSEDIEITAELIKTIGGEVEFKKNTCLLKATEIKNSLVPKLSRRNRLPILALGPLLHRKGIAEIPVLGGCPIGHRPINFHIEALTQMGIKIERRKNSYYAEAKKIHGARIKFDFPSVGATENVVLTATLAEGETVLEGAAVEPEILSLIDMLLKMGSKIKCDVEKRIIRINGVKKLKGCSARVIPDRNEVISFAVAALATKGEIFLSNISAEMKFACSPRPSPFLSSFLEKVKESGGNFTITGKGIKFFGDGNYKAISVETAPHPGFMTDWQQPFAVLLTKATGKSLIHETVYEDRFGYAKDLIRMGADIKISSECPNTKICRFDGKNFIHSATITGPTTLRGKDIKMIDIRAGMAHIIAALAAQGESQITGVEHIDRGYEKIDERLKRLGAKIERITING